MDKTTIEHFLHAQVRAWNAGDKEGFFAAYRSVAPRAYKSSMSVEVLRPKAGRSWKACGRSKIPRSRSKKWP